MQVIVAVFDKASKLYGRPIFVPAVGVAIRSFTEEINRPAEDNMLYKHPNDHDLYNIGTFDENSGILVSIQPSLLLSGQDATIKTPSAA